MKSKNPKTKHQGESQVQEAWTRQLPTSRWDKRKRRDRHSADTFLLLFFSRWPRFRFDEIWTCRQGDSETPSYFTLPQSDEHSISLQPYLQQHGNTQGAAPLPYLRTYNRKKMWRRSQSRLCRAPLSHKRGVMCLNTAAALALNPSCSIRWKCHQEPDRWVKLCYESCNGTNVLHFYIQKGLVTLHLTNRSWQQRGLFIYQLRESGGKKTDILLHTDWKALWGSHSAQSHICDNLNQISAA